MYKIVGGDQREYGPVTSDQVREWIATGRANNQTLASFEGAPWKPLSTFPEFADALRVATPPPIPSVAPPVGQGYAVPQSNNVAVWGLVLSVLGFFCLCSPLALVGLVLSVIGYSQIQKNPQAYTTTKIVPIIGIVVGLLSIVAMILVISSGALNEMMRNFPR
jgi:hypothetical protein